jgi:hypothetical protein
MLIEDYIRPSDTGLIIIRSKSQEKRLQQLLDMQFSWKQVRKEYGLEFWNYELN